MKTHHDVYSVVFIKYRGDNGLGKQQIPIFPFLGTTNRLEFSVVAWKGHMVMVEVIPLPLPSLSQEIKITEQKLLFEAKILYQNKKENIHERKTMVIVI